MSGTPQTDSVTLARTPLYDLHLELGARMVAFAGYHMPLQYRHGIIHEHQHTRAAAGLFDVSHMGQVRISGPGAASALEGLAPMDIVDLEVGQLRYGVFTDQRGGVLDDFMVANTGEDLSLVVNAACKSADIRRMREAMGGRLAVDERTDRAMLALQGPAAAGIMGVLAPTLGDPRFMTIRDAEVAGIPCAVSRSGYTGEDGFEISVPAGQAEALARRLLDNAAVEPVGLGARDSLRLEAGLCLYGQDLNRDTSPVEAGLGWTIAPARRRGGARAGGFPGEQRILAQLAEGAPRRLVGLRPQGRAPVRAGAELVDAEGCRVGSVTSGGFGPTLGAPVAMGYVGSVHGRPGTIVQAVVRGKHLPTEVVRLPFVERRYHRG
ncbi:MAG: glycine cleavage system aminomethyltransferase GcvT [Gammaproteobacteria bacterium]|nr:glycine cleavage system aminomethyltransferase GcvT [Gammaproteobacteria bacterium]NIN37234.1 glycine cleavage system aminomethyltransferase GcvT [Gammaproteobacteria bacterium]NIO26092.1 glycine cleavage system aminomethyltransferase GcvT [Gammaproteobacteria bacterium]NIO66705.1 glycine cleavage system aminomethyltransferase GcvT [Gammaproteobacteria bacterium]NIP46382.1 glycine cleavage system aminomethyltransferase GcvT [Gammaproteobacteria bacterium]